MLNKTNGFNTKKCIAMRIERIDEKHWIDEKMFPFYERLFLLALFWTRTPRSEAIYNNWNPFKYDEKSFSLT